jgi:heptosyltransferase III
MTAVAGPRRVAVYRLGSLGDTVVALPCLHAVAAAFPDAERIMLTNVPVSSKAAPLEAILGGSGLVHRFVAYPVGTRSWRALRALRATLRALDATTLVYLTPSRGLRAAWRDLLFFKWCGFGQVIGVPLTADLQNNRRGPDGLVEHEYARLARCVAALGPVETSAPAAWALHLTSAERDAAALALGAAAAMPRLSINMGGKVAENDWGEANWRALVGRLRETHADHALVFVGATEDAVRAEGVGSLWPGLVVNLCGRVSPRVSAAAMEGSRAFAGHDSGPLHLAASIGVPCVGLYGDKNEPRKWHPCGTGHRVIHDMRGVLAISVAQVELAVHALLAAPASEAPNAPERADRPGTVEAIVPASGAAAPTT